MGAPVILTTDRLILRSWRDDDKEPFATINADPRVMEFFRRPLSRAESNAMVDGIEEHFETHGFGLWAVEVQDGAPFIGFTGLSFWQRAPSLEPLVEIGWRLGSPYWGQGYATEAARFALQYGFRTARLTEIVSFTAARNLRSRAVMERIGMHHDPADDFDHTTFPEGHSLRSHVLYRVHAEAFER
jgi:ribosomal-protein-alanine N-acetyltransferase